MAARGHIMGGASSRDDGFSVLEAIVAVALLAVAFLPLLELQTGFISGLRGVERADTRMAAREVALVFVEITNFDSQPSGEVSFGEYTIKWSTKPILGPELMRGDEGLSTNYYVTLYEVQLQMETGLLRTQFVIMRGLGWSKISRLIDEF